MLVRQERRKEGRRASERGRPGGEARARRQTVGLRYESTSAFRSGVIDGSRLIEIFSVCVFNSLNSLEASGDAEWKQRKVEVRVRNKVTLGLNMK